MNAAKCIQKEEVIVAMTKIEELKEMIKELRENIKYITFRRRELLHDQRKYRIELEKLKEEIER